MNRRQFLISSSAAAVGTVACRASFGQAVETANQPAADVKQAELTVDFESATHLVPFNYSGVSYELSQLSKSNFFTAANTNLIAMFRLLSPRTECCDWEAIPANRAGSSPTLRRRHPSCMHRTVRWPRTGCPNTCL